jgi:hypothetical protein
MGFFIRCWGWAAKSLTVVVGVLTVAFVCTDAWAT